MSANLIGTVTAIRGLVHVGCISLLRIYELVTLSQFRCSASLLDRSEWVSARPAGYYDQHILGALGARTRSNFRNRIYGIAISTQLGDLASHDLGIRFGRRVSGSQITTNVVSSPQKISTAQTFLHYVSSELYLRLSGCVSTDRTP